MEENEIKKITGYGNVMVAENKKGEYAVINLDVEEDDMYEEDYGDGYGSHYGEYAGSYAQDVMGLSDDVINDAFEGDPDMCWNID